MASVSEQRPHRAYWRSVGTLMSGTLGAQVIGVASTLALARLYSPADFGNYAFFFVAAGLLAMLSTAKYDQAVFLAHDKDEAAGIAMLALGASGLLTLALLVAALVFGRLAPLPALLSPLEGHLPWLAVAVGSGGWLTALNALAIQQQSYGAVSRSRLAQAVLAAVVGIGLGVAGGGASGLVAGFVVGQVAAVAVLAMALRRTAPMPSRTSLLEHARRHARFPRYMLAGDLFNYVGNNLVPFATPTFFGAGALGQYNLGQRFATLPITIIGSSIGEVFRSGISPQHGSNAQTEALFRATAKRLAVVGLAITLPLLLAGPTLFELLLGPRWRDAGVYTQILAPLIFARFVVSPLSATLIKAGWQRLDALLQVLFVVTGVAAIAIGVARDSFMALVVSVSVLHTMVYGVYFLASHLASKRISGR